MKKKTSLIIIALFLVAIAWQLFLTAGFDFFWEDFDIFHVFWDKATVNSVLSEKYLARGATSDSKAVFLLAITREYVKNFFSPRRLFQIGFNSYEFQDRPYQFLTWDLWKILFNNTAFLYRCVKAIVFAANAIIIFLLIRRISFILAILCFLLYITSSEIWLSVVYISLLSPLAHLGTLLAIITFVRLTEKEPLSHSIAWKHYALILLFSNCAVLLTGDGRYLAMIFFAVLLFFRTGQLKFHSAPLFILFLMEFPLLGYLKKLAGQHDFAPVNIASHQAASSSTLSALFSAVKNCQFALKALGHGLVVIAIITVIVLTAKMLFGFACSVFSKKKGDETTSENIFVKERLLLFGLWFLAALAMSARARGFRYGQPYELNQFNFQLYDLAYFIAPFILFLSYFIDFVKSKLNKRLGTTFIYVCIFIMLLQIGILNILRLNAFRGGWGNFFIAWQNAKEYILNHSNSAKALVFTSDHYKTFVFTETGFKAEQTTDPCGVSNFCDLAFIERQLQENKGQDVFVASKSKLDFRGQSQEITMEGPIYINGDSGDWYDRFKKTIGRPSLTAVFLYHFTLKNEAGE